MAEAFGEAAVRGGRLSWGAIRRSARMTTPRPRAFRVCGMRFSDRALRVGPVQRQYPWPESLPKRCCGRGERQRHPPCRDQQPCPRPQHPPAQATQAPARPGCLGQDAAGDVHDAGQARQEISSLTSLQAKASTAGVFDFSFLPRLCDFARLVEDSAGASTSFNSPMWLSALPRSR